MIDAFFNFLKKSLVALMFVVVGFAMTYVPQSPASHVEEAHAGGPLGGFATEVTQLLNNALLGSSLVQETITAGAAASNWLKENTLDSIGWMITQRIVANMIRETLNWVASGFQGSPAFVTDLRGFLLNAADQEIGSIIQEFGGIASFICAPFRLDVQVAIATQYSRSRDSFQSAPTCTLTGIMNNIQGFISGIDPGNGLSDWIQITATPQTNTPYGAVLSAEATARARLINAQGEELSILNFGDGFLSQELCNSGASAAPVSAGTIRAQCSITTPGKVISEQINKSLQLPADLAIEADEITEAIVSGLTNLVSRAFNGSGGILGLSSSNPTYSVYSNGPSVDDIYNDATQQAANAGSGTVITTAITNETQFRDQAQGIRGAFAAFAANITNPASQRTRAQDVVTQIDAALTTANNNIATLTALDSNYATADDATRITILEQYTTLQPTLLSASSGSGQIAQWQGVANNLNITLP